MTSRQLLQSALSRMSEDRRNALRASIAQAEAAADLRPYIDDAIAARDRDMPSQGADDPMRG